MLTLGQQIAIEGFIKELVKLVQKAILTKEIERVSVRKVKGGYSRKRFKAPVSASGRLAKEVTYGFSERSASIYANEYIFELIYGKKPALSASDVNHNLERDIRKWMDDKGIALEEDSEKRNTIAYLIANKIQKFGSSIYLASHGQNSGLLENVVSNQLIQEYNSKFTKQLETEFQEAFVNGK